MRVVDPGELKAINIAVGHDLHQVLARLKGPERSQVRWLDAEELLCICLDELLGAFRRGSALREVAIDAADLIAAVPATWNLDYFRDLPGLHAADVTPGTSFAVEARDSVSSAPEIARLTLNMAMTHFDAAASIYGARLVFGGHAISIACAQVLRALPNIVTLIAWRGCDHLAPVFENDMLSSRLTVEAVTPLESGGALIDLRVIVHATRGPDATLAGQSQAADVLDWRVVCLMA